MVDMQQCRDKVGQRRSKLRMIFGSQIQKMLGLTDIYRVVHVIHHEGPNRQLRGRDSLAESNGEDEMR